MKIISRILQYFSKIKPRYFLSLDSQFYSLSHKSTIYRFKIFGEHTFPKFTFEDIKNDNAILYDIHPMDLMKITTQEYIASQRNSILSVSEILRNNKYKLIGINVEEILNGDEICNNILLIEKIKNTDLYKIAYNTGFNHGRQLAKNIQKDIIFDSDQRKIVSLSIVKDKAEEIN